MLTACLTLCGSGIAMADGPGGWFRTEEQRAAARLEAGEHEALAADAPDARWEALGRYGAGDHDGAAEAFARALESADGLSPAERDALRFGEATAETRAGRLDEALSLYDGILADDPDNADAAHNRDIVRALQALETDEASERQRRGGGGSAETPPDSSSDGGADGGGEQRAARQSGQEGERGQDSQDGSSHRDGTEGEAARADASGGDPDEGEGGTDRGSESERGESGGVRADRDRSDDRLGERAADGGDDESAAREALAAEAARASERDGAGAETAGGDGEERRATANGDGAYDEGDQATEQWLRRIPDDPAGLLRARLRQTHRDDYPEVGDGDEPW